MAHGRELLSKFLKDEDLSRADFSRRTGITEGMLSHYLTTDEEKRRSPGLEHAHTIEEKTGGAVPAESWIQKTKKRRSSSDRAA